MKSFLRELRAIFLIFLAVFCFRSSFLNWYVIPSGSLLPSLKIGDHVVVNKLSYGFMLPLMETQLFSWSSPKRGEIVVFKGPKSSKDLTMIKRVVGLPGDTVSFTNGVLTINGVQAQEQPVNDPLVASHFGNDNTYDKPYMFDIYQESGFSESPHYVMRLKYNSHTERETRVWKVPPHKLLLMGDNRDNSADGRVWGFMDEDRIYGRAFLVSYSTYSEDGSWFPKFRSERTFMKITK